MANVHNYQFLRDPLKLIAVLWPQIKLWSREVELIYSMWHNRRTVCRAGNMLGKDFTAALGVMAFYLTRTPCRIVTTSVDDTQLSGVLWGEIRNLLQTSKIPLSHDKGGPLLINDKHIRKVYTHGPLRGQVDGLSYLLGRVAAKGEGMLGHHIAETGDGVPRTMFVGDEASGLDDLSIERGETWADRMLLIGNPYPCDNAFRRWSNEGDKLSDRLVDDVRGVSLGEPERKVQQYDVKCIRISCAESPNVRLAEAQIARGEQPTGEMLVPGVMSHWKYVDRRKRWDKVKQRIQLDGEFYEGAELLLFPPLWLDASASLAGKLPPFRQRKARALGCDPGEGEAETAWYVIDEYGILEEVAYRTPDTSVIAKQTAALIRKWDLPSDRVMFDAGGGGKQIRDQMRDMGFHGIQTVGFGSAVSPPPRRGLTTIPNQIEQKEEAYVYVNRRNEMYDALSQLLNPSLPEEGQGPRFCIEAKYEELRRQLAPIPKTYDKEGRLKLPPKNKSNPESKEKTLIDIIGCSPDRADALVVALFCRDFALRRNTAGAA